jgi:hypothetical protein
MEQGPLILPYSNTYFQPAKFFSTVGSDLRSAVYRSAASNSYCCCTASEEGKREPSPFCAGSSSIRRLPRDAKAAVAKIIDGGQ